MIPDVIKKAEIFKARGVFRTQSSIYNEYFAKLVKNF